MPLLRAPTTRKSIAMRDSHSTDKDKSSILRLSLTALALIAGGLFLMMQDGSLAGSPQNTPQRAVTAALGK
jgi:hypothetical protein